MKVFKVRSSGVGEEGCVPALAENVPQWVKSCTTEKSGQNVLVCIHLIEFINVINIRLSREGGHASMTKRYLFGISETQKSMGVKEFKVYLSKTVWKGVRICFS